MTRAEIVVAAAEGRITWLDAAKVLRVTARHMRRLKEVYLAEGLSGVEDKRRGSAPHRRVKRATVEDVLRLKREQYGDFSTKHFHERLIEKHRMRISYSWTLQLLQAAGLADRAPSRGKYRRKRERRAMEGMMLHLDGSTHEWIAGRPKRDLIVMMDDATGKVLYARFVAEEGTKSTLEAILQVVRKHGRFCELYTDRGSHLCRTEREGEGPSERQDGQVSRALSVLGIKQILARSPEARGRGERMFRTIQGRLPPELREAGIRNWYKANDYLARIFVPDLNRRFAVKAAQPEKAFTTLEGIDLELILSSQYDRITRADNTIQFTGLELQLPPGRDRMSYARCPVVVHELVDDTLVVSFQGQRLARFDANGLPVPLRGALGARPRYARSGTTQGAGRVRSLRSPASPPSQPLA